MKFKSMIGMCIILIVALLLASCSSTKNQITGFAVDDTITQSTNTSQEITQDQTTASDNANDNADNAKDKEEKTKDKEKNTPPVWKSDINEFILIGPTQIDLGEYFSDEDGDSLAYLFTTPEEINVDVDASIVTLTPLKANFTATITFTATDGDKATAKDIALIVPPKSIEIELEYGSVGIYDIDNDGIEPTTGVVDFTVENSLFSWDADESKLCARWKIYSIETEEETTICYGNEKCCNFIGLGPTRNDWNEPFYSIYGQYGATSNNIVSAQVLYVDYGLSIDESFAEIYYSEWQNLTAKYYFDTIDFENVCVETCTLTNFTETGYKLIFEIDNAVLNLDTLTYSVIEEVSNVLINLDVENSEGLTSGNFTLYKDNVIVSIEEGFVAPDYYDVEIVPDGNEIEKLSVENANITKPVSASIGVDNVEREILIEDVDVKKRYAINLEELEFEKATLTATASANSLFKCKQWDYNSEVCFGSWNKIMDLIPGQQYQLTLTADDPGFVEGNSNITIAPINITNVTGLELIQNIPNLTISKNTNATIDLSNYFSNIDDTTTFTYYQQAGITILFSNEIATIVPDTDFIGIVYTFITATKNDDVSVSNVFSITVTNATIDITAKDCSEFLRTDDGLYYCADDEKFYSCKGFENIDTSNEYIGDLTRCKEARLLKDTVDKSMCPFKHKDCNVTVDMDKGWGARQSDEKSSYKLSTFKENFYCGSGHCEVPFYFKSKADISGKLDFNVAADTLLSNISIKRVLEDKNETAGKDVSMKQHDSYYYVASFDYEPVWTEGRIKTTKPLKFNISASLDGIKILELDPIMHESFATDNSVDIRDVAIPNIPVTCNAGDILIIGVAIQGAGTPSVTYGGQSASLINTIDQSTVQASMFNSSNCNGASQNVVVSVSGGGNNLDAVGMVSRYSGADYVDNTADVTASGTVSPATVTVNTAVAGDYAVDTVGVLDAGGDSSIVVVPGDNVNERSTAGGVDPGGVLGGRSDDGGLIGGAATMSWTVAEAWAIVAVPLVAPFVPDITPPTINITNINNSNNVRIKDRLNISAYMTGTPTLANFTFNLTGATNKFNFSYAVSGSTVWTSQNITVNVTRGSVINATVVACDSVPNCAENSTLITITDFYASNMTIGVNDTSAQQFDSVNISGNATDYDVIDFAWIEYNRTGSLNKINYTFFKGAVTASFWQNFTIDLTAGNVLNFSIYVNDTSGLTNYQNSTLVTIIDGVAPAVNITNVNASQSLSIKNLLNISCYGTDETALSKGNITFNLSGTSNPYSFLFTLSSLSAVYSQNMTINATRGNVINASCGINDGTNNAINSTLITVADTLGSIFIGLNLTSVGVKSVINVSGNCTDVDRDFSLGTISYNVSGNPQKNYSFGLASDIVKANFSQNVTINLTVGNVINFTAFCNDTIGTLYQNSTLVNIIDIINPIVNTTLNKSLTSIFQNDIINLSANATDETQLFGGQIIVNETGENRFYNFSLSGTAAQFSQNITVTCAAGCVINFTARANDTSGNFRTNDTIITVVASNEAPIIKLNNASTFSVDPVAGGDSVVLISFNVTDAQGVGDINASKAIVNLTLGTPGFSQFRFNFSDQGGEFGTCKNHTEPGPGAEAARIIINCTILLRYYDNASSVWVINVSVPDLSNVVGRNDTMTFTYNTLSGLSLPDTFVNFSSVFLGQQNVPSTPLYLNNTGNEDFDMLNVSAALLRGTTTTTETIAATSFYANISNETAGGGMQLATTPVSLLEWTGPNNGRNVTFMHGHTSAFAPNMDKGNRTVFFWVDVPTGSLSSQLYNATWNITVINNP